MLPHIFGPFKAVGSTLTGSGFPASKAKALVYTPRSFLLEMSGTELSDRWMDDSCVIVIGNFRHSKVIR